MDILDILYDRACAQMDTTHQDSDTETDEPVLQVNVDKKRKRDETDSEIKIPPLEASDDEVDTHFKYYHDNFIKFGVHLKDDYKTKTNHTHMAQLAEVRKKKHTKRCGIQIVQLDVQTNKMIKKFETIRACANQLNMTPLQVNRLVNSCSVATCPLTGIRYILDRVSTKILQRDTQTNEILNTFENVSSCAAELVLTKYYVKKLIAGKYVINCVKTGRPFILEASDMWPPPELNVCE